MATSCIPESHRLIELNWWIFALFVAVLIYVGINAVQILYLQKKYKSREILLFYVASFLVLVSNVVYIPSYSYS